MKRKNSILFVMKTLALLSLLILLPIIGRAECHKKPIVIAVIDTGFGYKDAGHEARLCKFGHKDFSIERQFTKDYGTKDLVPVDVHGHGTNIVGIIESYVRQTKVNYCIVVLKYYSANQSGRQNLYSEIEALRYANNLHVDFINYSGGGPEFDEREYIEVEKFLNAGGKFVAAAGNEHSNIDLVQNYYYPASYDKRIIVVGNGSSNDVRSDSSNYGNRVDRWEIGHEVTAYGVTMSGTSQATAVATGKIVSENTNRCDIGF